MTLTGKVMRLYRGETICFSILWESPSTLQGSTLQTTPPVTIYVQNYGQTGMSN